MTTGEKKYSKNHFVITVLLLLLSLAPLSVAAQISGCVLDAETGDSIPCASIMYKGTRVAIVSGIDGTYSIARHNGWKLVFSAVGYVSQSVDVTQKTKDVLVVRLKPDNKMLTNVTVKSKRHRYRRKDNPAVALMRKVIAHKKKTDLDNRDFYQYNKYQKITLAINDITEEKLEAPRFKKKPWLKDHIERCEYNQKLILPLSVDETVTQKIFRRKPKAEKNIVKGESSSGINDIFQTGDILTTTLKDVFTDVNIYDDQVRLLQYPSASTATT